jgi:hypothetical protein
MAVTKTGNISEYYADGVAIQPGYKLTELDDGTISGTVTFECDLANFANLPQVGAAHHRDSRAELYARDITYLPLEKVRLVGSYFGLVAAKTDSILSYTPNTDREVIETHKDFAEFAGDADSPLNGAEFDAETGEFLGFFDNTNDLFGTRYYLTPSTQVSLTYWTRNKPSLKRRMSIVASVPGFNAPPDVADFLRLDMPYRQVGSHYQVTEIYLGSGPNGWNSTVYPGS